MRKVRIMKKSERVPINLTPTKKDEVERWARCEGLSISAYMVSLHNDHVRYAHEHGLPIPPMNDAGILE